MRGSIAALPDSLTHQTGTKYRFLCVLDAIFSSVIVAPAVVGYWRSVWELMELYVCPGDQLSSALVSTAIGIIGHLLFGLSQDLHEKWLNPQRSKTLFYFASRVYTVCFAFICVNGWRGPWQLLDMYAKMDMVSVMATTLVGIVALAAMRALRNVSATPFSVVLDSAKGYFEVPTMFRVAMSERTSLYILDCLFSVLVVGTLVVFVWRGAWGLIDIYFFPEDEILSSWASLIVGYAAVALAFLLQPIMKWLCDQLTGASRLLIADLFLLFSLVGTVNVWRGIWNLLNLYFLPDNIELSCWITHWVCLGILVALGCSNSLLVRGVYIDAEEPGGKCVVFPCYYLRLIFQDQKVKFDTKLPTEFPEKGKTELVNVKPLEINNHVVVNVHNDDEQFTPNHHIKEET